MKITSHFDETANRRYFLARCNDLNGLPIRTVGETRLAAMIGAYREVRARSC